MLSNAHLLSIPYILKKFAADSFFLFRIPLLIYHKCQCCDTPYEFIRRVSKTLYEVYAINLRTNVCYCTKLNVVRIMTAGIVHG